jgi:hypothetical protein
MEWPARVLLVWTAGFAAVFGMLWLVAEAPLIIAAVLGLAGAWVIGELVAARAQARTHPAFKPERRPH